VAQGIGAPIPSPSQSEALPKPGLPVEKMPAAIGRFQIRSVLGAGAYGTVYRAFDPHLEREVALKVPRAETLDSPKSVERFLREAKAAARLRHPHIVPVFDTGRDGELLYIASAFIEGRTLARAIDEGVSFTRAAEIVRDLAEALAYAHHLGIVHRDVKPANIMLDLQGEAHLMDFGLAHRQDSAEKLTQDGTILGTPAYMAPEHAGGSSGLVQPASDQYSLGVILYELLCGQTPFSGPAQIVLFNALNTEPPPPRGLKPHIPRDLETICLKALAKRPEERYAACAEMAEDLRRWLALEPIQARRMGVAERLMRWCKREPALAVTILAVAACLVIVTLVATWAAANQAASAEKERVARDDADHEKSIAEQALAQAKEATRDAEQQRKNAEAAAELAKKKERETADALAKVTEANKDRSAAVAEQNRLKLEADKANALAEKNSFLYFHLIARADHELAGNRFDTADRLLDSCAPFSRRWEWYYLKRRCGPAGIAVVGGSMAFSRDGSLLAIVPERADQTGRRWIALATGAGWPQQTLNVPAAGNSVAALDLSPDGTHLALGLENGGAIYDVKSKNLHRPLASGGDIHSVVYSSDGRLLATGLHRKVTLWNPTDGTRAGNLTGHTGQVSALAFHPHATFLASASNSGSLLLVWDHQTGKPVLSVPLPVPTGIAFSPDGKLLACVLQDGTLRLWESGTWRDSGSVKIYDRKTRGISFSPDGKRVAVGCGDGTVRVWDIEKRQEVYALEMHSAPVTAVAWSSDGKRIASAANGLVRAGNAEPFPEGRPKSVAPIKRGPKKQVNEVVPITALAFSPDSKRLAIGFSSINRPAVPATLAYRDKGDLAVSGISSLQVIDLTGETVLHDWPKGGVANSDPAAASLVDPATGASRRIWQAAPGAGGAMLSGRPRLVRFSPDGKHAAVLFGRDAKGKETIVVDLVDSWENQRPAPVEGWVQDIEISRDGKRVLVCRRNQEMQYWDIPNLQPQSLRSSARHAVFSPDGKRLASIDRDNGVTIWDLDKGSVPEPALPGLKCTSLAFSPDGTRLATASWDRSVRIWDTATRQEILTLRGHRAAVTQVAFSPDGRRLVSADADGTIMFWEGTVE